MSWPVLVPLVYVLGFSLGGVVDSPGYLSHLQLVISQHPSKAAASQSLASDHFLRICGKCGSLVSSCSPSIKGTFSVFLTSHPRSPRAPHSEERSALCAPFHHVVKLSELMTILSCCLSVCGSCLNHVLTRKESCRSFVHYYVLKEKGSRLRSCCWCCYSHFRCSGHFHTVQTPVSAVLGRSSLSPAKTDIFEVLTLNCPVFTFGGEQNLAYDSANNCGGLKVKVHGFFSLQL